MHTHKFFFCFLTFFFHYSHVKVLQYAYIYLDQKFQLLPQNIHTSVREWCYTNVLIFYNFIHFYNLVWKPKKRKENRYYVRWWWWGERAAK